MIEYHKRLTKTKIYWIENSKYIAVKLVYTGGLIIVFGRTSDLEETFWVLYFFSANTLRGCISKQIQNYDDLSRLVYIFRRKRENMKQQSYVHQKFVTKVKICYCQVTSQLSAIRAALSGKISSSSTSLASQSVHNLDFQHLKKKIYNVCPKHLWEISFIFSWHMFLTRESQSGGQMKVSEEVWVKTIQLWKSKEDIRNRILASRDLKIYQHENDISPNLQQNDILS